MSNEAVLRFFNERDDFGTLDRTLNFDGNLKLEPNTPTFVRLLSATLTKQIPNIYEYNGFNNNKLIVTNDNWVTQHEIVLPNGTYTLLNITGAVTETIRSSVWGAGWYTNFDDPGIVFEANLATGKVVIILDNTKGPAAQFGVTLYGSTVPVGTLYTTLGWTFATAVITNAAAGTRASFEAPLIPKLDTQGTSVYVQTSLDPEFSYYNNRNTQILFNFPLSVQAPNANEYVFPVEGMISPYMRIKNSGNITGWDIKFLRDNGESFVFLYGSATLNVQLTHSAQVK